MTAIRKFKFTKTSVDKAVAPESDSSVKAIEYTDASQSGLKLQVTKSGSRIFWARYTFNSDKRALRIGEFPGISVEEARSRVQEILADVDRGIDPLVLKAQFKAMPTFTDFVLKEAMPHFETYKRSADDDKSKITRYMIPHFGRMRLCDISVKDVQTYLGGLKVKLQPATINRHRSLLMKLFNLAVDWERITQNPLNRVAKLQEPAARERYLKPEECQRLMAAASVEENVYAGAAIRFLLLTGVRREEALQARWNEVDLEKGTLFLLKTKNGKTREVVLNQAALELLKGLPRVPGSPWVFPGRDPKRPLCNPLKAFLRVLTVAGLPHMRIHDLRHSHASLLVNQGVSLYTVQNLLGHSSVQTTQRYAHLADQTLREASQKVSLIAGGVT